MIESPHIRKIRPDDNSAVAAIIRNVMSEFGAMGCGYSSEDAEVDSMCEAYADDLGFFPLQIMLQVVPVTSPAAPKNWSFMTGH